MYLFHQKEKNGISKSPQIQPSHSNKPAKMPKFKVMSWFNGKAKFTSLILSPSNTSTLSKASRVHKAPSRAPDGKEGGQEH